MRNYLLGALLITSSLCFSASEPQNTETQLTLAQTLEHLLSQPQTETLSEALKAELLSWEDLH